MVDLIDSVNTTEIVADVISSAIQSIPYLWSILRAAGLLFIAYIIFLFLKSFATFKTNRRVKHIEAKVDLIMSKLGIDSKELKKEKKRLHKENKVKTKTENKVSQKSSKKKNKKQISKPKKS